MPLVPTRGIYYSHYGDMPPPPIIKNSCVGVSPIVKNSVQMNGNPIGTLVADINGQPTICVIEVNLGFPSSQTDFPFQNFEFNNPAYQNCRFVFFSGTDATLENFKKALGVVPVNVSTANKAAITQGIKAALA